MKTQYEVRRSTAAASNENFRKIATPSGYPKNPTVRQSADSRIRMFFLIVALRRRMEYAFASQNTTTTNF